jgi:hypothetical protein
MYAVYVNVCIYVSDRAHIKSASLTGLGSAAKVVDNLPRSFKRRMRYFFDMGRIFIRLVPAIRAVCTDVIT